MGQVLGCSSTCGLGRMSKQENSAQNLLPWRQASAAVGVGIREVRQVVGVASPASQVVQGREQSASVQADSGL